MSGWIAVEKKGVITAKAVAMMMTAGHGNKGNEESSPAKCASAFP